MGLLPTYYQTNFKFNINDNSEAEGTADHVTLLRLFPFVQRGGKKSNYSFRTISKALSTPFEGL